jgi:hypothetical protein
VGDEDGVHPDPRRRPEQAAEGGDPPVALSLGRGRGQRCEVDRRPHAAESEPCRLACAAVLAGEDGSDRNPEAAEGSGDRAGVRAPLRLQVALCAAVPEVSGIGVLLREVGRRVAEVEDVAAVPKRVCERGALESGAGRDGAGGRNHQGSD